MKYAYLALIPLLLAPDALFPGEFAASAQQGHPGGPPQGARPPGGNPGHPPGNPGRPPSGGGNAARPQPQPHPQPQPKPQPQPPRPGGGSGNANRPHPQPPQQGGNRPPQPGNPRPPSGNQRPPSNNYRPPSNNYRPPVVTQPHRPGSGRPSTFRPMHAPPYRYPHGYSYRRWQTHMILPSLFLSAPYLFQDYAMMGVGPPPPGYYWVRYGPDLLLVDRRTRMVVDVIYSAFYY